ncbi:hypothetical protein AWB69_03873 [Caballeronia udeis]|uniref:Uncharacterized protein n=2 Tax=Caballeronia udeis TaxID=1232866 RepID=A0A158H4E9_9BURK|nr:hypothetical protein AWB69_03873 [Caballeronia udeis]
MNIAQIDQPVVQIFDGFREIGPEDQGITSKFVSNRLAGSNYLDFWSPHVFYPAHQGFRQHDLVVLVGEDHLANVLRVPSIGCATERAWRRAGVPIPSMVSIERAGVYLRWKLTEPVWTRKNDRLAPRQFLYQVATGLMRALAPCRLVGGIGDVIPHPLRFGANTTQLSGDHSLESMADDMGVLPAPDPRFSNVFMWTHRRPIFCFSPGILCDDDGVILERKPSKLQAVSPKEYSPEQMSRGGQTRARKIQYANRQALLELFSDGKWRTVAEMQAQGIKGARKAITNQLTENGFRKRRRAGRGTVPEWLPQSLDG